MTKISRNDIFARDERGPDWFNDFLRSFADSKPETVRDILGAINKKKSETVESVVAQYREQAGLDALNEDTATKTASISVRDNMSVKKASNRPISIRHAKMNNSFDAVLIIKKDPKLIKIIDSFCEHSGGTKNTLSILDHLRGILGQDKVSYSDSALKEFIEERKERFKSDEYKDDIEVGLVGQDSNKESYDDELADYQTYDGVAD